jgi:hypothetical protein
MNIKKITLSITSICLIAGVSIAQDKPNEGLETTTVKTYKINMGDEMETRTVEVNTNRNSELMMKDSDEGNINQARVMDSMPKITKTVKIDNDKDDAFDEKIVFTYNSDNPEDFVLVSKDKNLLVAIDKGENLEIVEDMTLKSKNEANNKSTYIFTDENGKEIEFLVEEHTNMTNQ